MKQFHRWMLLTLAVCFGLIGSAIADTAPTLDDGTVLSGLGGDVWTQGGTAGLVASVDWPTELTTNKVQAAPIPESLQATAVAERSAGLKDSEQNASGDADGPQRLSSGIDMQGTAYVQVTSSKARMQVSRIVNNRSGGRSGTLYLEIWVTPATPGATIYGYRIASSRLGELPGGYYYSNVDRTVSLSGKPPKGCYYWSLVLREYGNGYSDYAVLNTCLVYSKGTGVCCGNSSEPGCYVGVSTTSKKLSYRLQKFTIATQSKKNWEPCGWYATSDQSWMGFNLAGDDDGLAGASVKVYADENTTGVARTGYLNIYRESDDRLVRRVKIVQKKR